MWPKLKRGNKIAIVSTGYALNQENANLIIENLKKAFPEFEFVVPDDLLSDECKNNKTGVTMISNTPEMRAKHLIDAIKDDEVKAIWNLTGSEGSAEVIDFVRNDDEKHRLPRTDKPFIGMSDVTALLIYLGQENLVTPIHASLLTTLFVPSLKMKFPGITPAEVAMVRDLLLAGNELQHHPLASDLQPLNLAAQNTNEVSGRLIGGWKEMLGNSLGTEWQVNTKNSILVIEGLDYPWPEKGGINVMKQLQAAGVLHEVKAIIFGGIESFKRSQLTDKEAANKENESIRKAFFDEYKNQVKEFAEQLNIPVYGDFKFGHELHIENTPVPFFSLGTIKRDDNKIQFSCDLTVARPVKEYEYDIVKHSIFKRRTANPVIFTQQISLTPLLHCSENINITTSMIGGCIVNIDRELGINDKFIAQGRILFLDFQSPMDKQIDLKSKIPIYLHAMLVHLKQGGIFNSNSAIIIGKYPVVTSDQAAQEQFVSELRNIMTDFFHRYHINSPVFQAEEYDNIPDKFLVDHVSIVGSNGKAVLSSPNPYAKDESFALKQELKSVHEELIKKIPKRN